MPIEQCGCLWRGQTLQVGDSVEDSDQCKQWSVSANFLMVVLHTKSDTKMLLHHVILLSTSSIQPLSLLHSTTNNIAAQ